MIITSKQRSVLKGIAMTTDPIFQIGKSSLTPELTEAVGEALDKRELVKISVLQNCMEEPEDAITMLAERADVNLVQIIGRNGLLYKRNFDKPKIELP